MNIACLFSAYKILAADLQREREAHAETQRLAKEERERLTDAVMKVANKPPVYRQPEHKEETPIPSMAFGPTAIAAKRAMEEDEITRRAEEARTRANQNGG